MEAPPELVAPEDSADDEFAGGDPTIDSLDDYERSGFIPAPGESEPGYDVRPPHAERPAPAVVVTSIERVRDEKLAQAIGVRHWVGLVCFEAVVFAIARRTDPAAVAFVIGVLCYFCLPFLDGRGPSRAFFWWSLLLTYVIVALAALGLG